MIYEKLSKFHEKIGTVTKDSKNQHFKNKYASIESVLETIQSPLKDSGLCFVQLVDMDCVRTILSEVDGEDKIECKVPLILSKNDMQGLGSAITYARRYGLVTMLGIIQEDDDGNKACEKPQQQETLSGYLASKGVKHVKEFCETNGINAANAKEFLSNKTILDGLISDYFAKVQ